MSQHDHQRPESQKTPLAESGFELREPNRPIPIWVLAVTVAAMIWGFYTLWADSGPATETAAEAEAPTAGMNSAPAIADNKSALVSAGATIFAANCATCHQANGSGIRQAVPPLVGARYVTGRAETPVQILLHGIKGPIEVAGNQYDGRMPRFGETLTDSQIAAVVSYIRQQWGNSAAVVEPAFVVQQRERFTADRGPWSGGAELEQVTGVPARLARATAEEASQ